MQGDVGLIGRKIIVDTYGGWGVYGGGVFFGKDFFKVDRFVVYVFRWVVKLLVKVGLCKRVLVQVRGGVIFDNIFEKDLNFIMYIFDFLQKERKKMRFDQGEMLV